MRNRPKSRTLAVSAACAAVLPFTAMSLSACGLEQKADTPTISEYSDAPETTSEAEASISASSSVPTSSWPAETAIDLKGRRDVREVAEKFASLAPVEFFDKFTSCDSNGIPDSHACNGPDVGQFQFFTGDAKAASTTQLLTELRSSRVVDDSGDRIVGWSTLGTTAVITVVDNKRGLTMQQMVSSDKQDPRQRIYELGLAQPDRTTEPRPSSTPASATPTETR